jgi:hypothetical protein
MPQPAAEFTRRHLIQLLGVSAALTASPLVLGSEQAVAEAAAAAAARSVAARPDQETIPVSDTHDRALLTHTRWSEQQGRETALRRHLPVLLRPGGPAAVGRPRRGDAPHRRHRRPRTGPAQPGRARETIPTPAAGCRTVSTAVSWATPDGRSWVSTPPVPPGSAGGVQRGRPYPHVRGTTDGAGESCAPTARPAMCHSASRPQVTSDAPPSPSRRGLRSTSPRGGMPGRRSEATVRLAG